MDVPTPIDSRLNVDGRLSESPLPTYDGVPVSSSLSRYVVSCWWEGAGVGGGWVAGGGTGERDGFPPRIRYGAGFSRERRLGGRPYGGTEGRERGDGFPLSRERRLGGSPWVPAPYQVRGRLFAGTTVGEPPLRWDGGEREGMGSRPVSGTGQAFRGNDGWGAAPGFLPRIRVRGRLFAGRTDGGCG